MLLKRTRARIVAACIAVLLLCFATPPPARAYSLLTHEQLIDLTWRSSIVPLLLSRYPTLTPEQLEHARAYAYGGCVIQDIGYYPFGDPFFSDLTHYVRSGDFVVNLFRNAGNADELAFAVGALSHYLGDTIGHPEATNLAVPIEFPKLRARYGPVVNYAQAEHPHVQTEFAFDINEIAHHRFAPVHYLRAVGLAVPIRQVGLAFYQTYGLRDDLTSGRGRRINVRGYRFAVRRFIPRIAYAVTVLHRHDMPADTDNAELRELQREIDQIAAENHWDRFRRKPGIGTYSLAGLLWVLPKIGPIKLAAVKGPTEATEVEYIHSVVTSTAALRSALARFTPPPTPYASATEAAAADTHSQPPPSRPSPADPSARQDTPRDSRDPAHPLPNRDLDTGAPVRPGGYRLTDDTYAGLLHRLTRMPSQPIPPGIQTDIEAYYANPEAPILTKNNPDHWAAVQADLATLRAMPISTEPDPYPTYTQASEETPALPAPTSPAAEPTSRAAHPGSRTLPF